MKFKNLKYRFIKIYKKIIAILGTIFLIMIFLSFTDLPFWGYYWLGTGNTDEVWDPDYIVILGSHGMPSPEGLIRCYYAAELAKEDSLIPIIIALPTRKEKIRGSDIEKMRKELIIRGIDSTRILLEISGINTYEQAQNIAGLIDNKQQFVSIRLITSPENMYRSVLTFKKARFCDVGGTSSFEKNLDQSVLRKKKKTKIADEFDDSLTFRYNMWNYFKYEITVLRECCAIIYYKLRGWA